MPPVPRSAVISYEPSCCPILIAIKTVAIIAKPFTSGETIQSSDIDAVSTLLVRVQPTTHSSTSQPAIWNWLFTAPQSTRNARSVENLDFKGRENPNGNSRKCAGGGVLLSTPPMVSGGQSMEYILITTSR